MLEWRETLNTFASTVEEPFNLHNEIKLSLTKIREIVKQIGACKWRPDARAISVRHVGRFGKKSVIASQIFPRRGRFYSPSVRIPSQNGGR